MDSQPTDTNSSVIVCSCVLLLAAMCCCYHVLLMLLLPIALLAGTAAAMWGCQPDSLPSMSAYNTACEAAAKRTQAQHI